MFTRQDLLEAHANNIVFPIAVGHGWAATMNEMMDEMKQVDPHVVVSMKSKFAELRLNIRASIPGVQNRLYFIFQQTKQVLEHVCEECGQEGQKGMFDGAMMVLCPTHAIQAQ